MAETMMTMPRSGNGATLLGNDATPLNTRLATTTARSGDNANLGDDAMPLGACLVTTTPSSETLGDKTKLGNNSMLGDDATLTNDATPLGDNTKHIARTLRRDAQQQRRAQ